MSETFPLRWRTNLSAGQLRSALRSGARCVRYDYTVSLLVATWLFQSRVHLVRTDDGRFGRGFVYMLASLFLGPWALPWGPILTLECIWSNAHGGRDVTAEIVEWLDTAEGIA